MEIIYLSKADNDLSYRIASGNKPILKKIAEFTRAVLESHYTGIKKPELLKYNLSGLWSRRINSEHRFVYKIEANTLYLYSVKGHY